METNEKNEWVMGFELNNISVKLWHNLLCDFWYVVYIDETTCKTIPCVGFSHGSDIVSLFSNAIKEKFANARA